MGFIDYIKPVKTISVEEFKERFNRMEIKDYNLIDVRQPDEYEKGHIPGSVLIPVSSLKDNIDNMDKDKPTVAYCAVGGRSRAAASILENENFKEVYSLSGGIKAWDGTVATGPPDYGMVLYRDVKSTGEMVALSWIMEENTFRFYQEMVKSFKDEKFRDLFEDLSISEEKHRASVNSLYYRVTGKEELKPYPDIFTSDKDVEDILEGGMKYSEVLDWSRGKTGIEILEFALSMEAQLLDLYTRLAGASEDAEARDVLLKLADDEKIHFNRLTELYRKTSA